MVQYREVPYLRTQDPVLCPISYLGIRRRPSGQCVGLLCWCRDSVNMCLIAPNIVLSAFPLGVFRRLRHRYPVHPALLVD